jgi:uncharacterized protein YjdB
MEPREITEAKKVRNTSGTPRAGRLSDYNPHTMTLNVASPQTIAPAATLQLTPTLLTKYGETPHIDRRAVSYVSSDPTKATVNGSGLITGVADGDTTITVTSTYGDASTTLLVHVVT